MRKILLMSSALALLSGTVEAGCIQTPSCSSLGYSSTTACEGGLKCPWGNAWFCNVGGGSDNDNAATCVPGAIFNSDRSCSEGQEVGKVPIGIVVYADGKGHGQAIALESITAEQKGELVDIEGYIGYIRKEITSVSDERACNSQNSSRTGYCSSIEFDVGRTNSEIQLANIEGIKGYANLEEASIDFDSKGLTDTLLKVKNENLSRIQSYINQLTKYDSILAQSTKSLRGYVNEACGSKPSYTYLSLREGSFSQYSSYLQEEIVIGMFDAAEKVRQYKTTGTSAGEWNLPAPGVFNSIKVYEEQIKAGFKSLSKTMPTNLATSGFYIDGNNHVENEKFQYLDSPLTKTPPNFNSKYIVSISYENSWWQDECLVHLYLNWNNLPYISIPISDADNIIYYSKSALYGTTSSKWGTDSERTYYPVINF